MILDWPYMLYSGPLPLTFEGSEQGFGVKTAKKGSPGKPC